MYLIRQPAILSYNYVAMMPQYVAVSHMHNNVAMLVTATMYIYIVTVYNVVMHNKVATL